METEFNLSEKVFDQETKGTIPCPCVAKDDVKEFIRLLKSNFKNYSGERVEIINEIIDKLAGEKLNAI